MHLKNYESITVLATSDLHGHLHPTDYRSRDEHSIGLGKLATLIRAERSIDPALLLIDNGDLIQGSPLASYSIKNNTDTHPLIAALNDLCYDAAVPGNHEFNYGLDVLTQVVRSSDFPWLSAGILYKDNELRSFCKPYVMKMVNGIRVAILGVTTHYIPNWEQPAHIAPLAFLDALETVKMWVPRIRQEEQPDVMIVSYHGGFERDLLTGELTEALTGENQAYAMCSEVEGIDVLITGHQHRLLAEQLNGVAIIQPGCNGQAIGKITIDFIQEHGRWTIVEKHAELLHLNSDTLTDIEILSSSMELEEQVQSWLDQPVGLVDGDMRLMDPMSCRLAETPFIEFINRAQMETAGVNISCTALLSNSSKGFNEVITRRELLSNFPFPNTLVVLRLHGRDLRAALEQTACYFTIDSYGNPAVNPAFLEPKPQHYNYDMWEGVEYRLNIANPPGSRVIMLNYNGKELLDDMELDVVMNNYRAGGGGNYDMFKGKMKVREILIDTAELLEEYIVARGSIIATCNSNWEVVHIG